MLRTMALKIALVGFALVAGCDQSPTDAENAARDAQRRAQQEADSAQRKADEAAANAQAKANEEAARAEQTLIKARNDLREKTQKDLNDMSARIDDLQAKAARSTGTAKAELDAAWKDLDAQRAAVRRDLDSLERTTSADFDAAKARIDADLAALRKRLDGAGPKI